MDIKDDSGEVDMRNMLLVTGEKIILVIKLQRMW
jgi:hypothetical protein